MRSEKNKSTLEGGGGEFLSLLHLLAWRSHLWILQVHFERKKNQLSWGWKNTQYYGCVLEKKSTFFVRGGGVEGSCAFVAPFGIKIPQDYRPKNREKCSILSVCFEKRIDFRVARNLEHFMHLWSKSHLIIGQSRKNAQYYRRVLSKETRSHKPWR